MVKKTTDKLFWIDLEMTGLDPNKDLILEVASIITDWDFNELDSLDEPVFADANKILERMVVSKAFWDDNPKARDSLIERSRTAKSMSEVENILIKQVNKYTKPDEVIVLAGNSIHQDRRFIENYWPNLLGRLHYRMLDVSAWKVVLEGKYNKKFTKPDEHRALSDIRGSIEELKYYLKYMGK